MVLAKFNTWPSPKRTRLVLIVAFILMIVIYAILGFFFFLSGDQTNMLASQLSFNGTSLKAQYATILPTIEAYRIAQILDYGFMATYAAFIFALALTIARKFDEKAPLRKIGFCIALLGFVAAGLDAMENVFILLTLTNPLSFPDWWAVAHSCFALPKWIILIIAVGWAVAAVVTLRSQRTGKAE
jgi:hypothetical protein